MGKIAFVFPGQGSQHVGMGKDFFDQCVESRELLKVANDTLKFDLQNIMFEGPEEELTKTYNAQPALVTASIIALQQLRKEGIQPDFVAGHSLGEYSALVASEVLTFADAVELVHQRGMYMNEAVPAGEGAMLAVLGATMETLKDVEVAIEREGDVVNIANINSSSQVVLSGTVQGIQRAQELLTGKAKRLIPLQVSGPFHSSLMKPAAEQFATVLQQKEFRTASVPVVCNVTAELTTDAEQLRENLVTQIYSSVRWVETIQNLLHEGVDTFVEVGSGKVLAGLIKSIHRRATIYNVNDVASLQETVKSLRGE